MESTKPLVASLVPDLPENVWVVSGQVGDANRPGKNICVTRGKVTLSVPVMQ